MNIKELSIGDWVRHTFYEENVRIVRLYGDSERVLAEKGKLSIQCHLNHFEPIPLTPEIWEKNGFTLITEKDVQEQMLNPKLAKNPVWGLKIGGRPASHLVAKQRADGSFTITTANLEMFKHKIVYVHQLQHALRLAGIEKEIEL
jgi:hypothetical protein